MLVYLFHQTNHKTATMKFLLSSTSALLVASFAAAASSSTPTRHTRGLTVNTRKCFETKSELVNAVDAYLGRYKDEMIMEYREIRDWCVSKIDDFSVVFKWQQTFNEPLDGWDVCNAVTFHGMFLGASSFNQDISIRETGNVCDMSYMFLNAFAFDQDLHELDTSKVTNM